MSSERKSTITYTEQGRLAVAATHTIFDFRIAASLESNPAWYSLGGSLAVLISNPERAAGN